MVAAMPNVGGAPAQQAAVVVEADAAAKGTTRLQLDAEQVTEQGVEYVRLHLRLPHFHSYNVSFALDHWDNCTV